ncbi:hypothetical protein IKQ26_08975 [bacterium]|nr:hypothetical protein [bacterium]
MAQTTARAIADYGPVTTWEIGTHGNVEDAKTFVNKYMIPYMNVAKKPMSLAEGNWNSELYFLNGSPVDPDSNDGVNHQVRFYLSDGTSISCYVQSQSSDWKRLSILIDINGDKKPNKFGRDVFMFEYLIYVNPNHIYYPFVGKIVPDFGNGISSRSALLSNSAWNCHKNQQGTPCAAVIVRDGWRIADDYPW